MGRNAAGVKGISLRENDEVVSMQIIEPDTYLLHITNKGIGKRTKENEYRKTNRGGKGYFVCKLTEETGHVADVEVVEGTEDVMLIKIHVDLDRISVVRIYINGSQSQVVRIIRHIEQYEDIAVNLVTQYEQTSH